VLETNLRYAVQLIKMVTHCSSSSSSIHELLVFTLCSHCCCCFVPHPWHRGLRLHDFHGHALQQQLWTWISIGSSSSVWNSCPEPVNLLLELQQQHFSTIHSSQFNCSCIFWLGWWQRFFLWAQRVHSSAFLLASSQ
jgi:hypothetical protein